MRVCGDMKWIPSISLEPSDPTCSTKYHYTSLSALHQANLHDSRSSRSSVSNDTVREEPNRSYSIIGVMDELAAMNLTELNPNNNLTKTSDVETYYVSTLCVPIVSKETISYTIDDNGNTPIPPLPSPTNNSRLYQFLFQTIDTDSDDDDMFPTSLIDLNYNENKTNPPTQTTFIRCKHLWEL